ncbi:type II toxin-antitoxin system PemK/MazF family toxin [bacterium]|nr:type II toxin-antitoxin system PemK/MazF family toxin [bacterium]
MGNLSKKPIFRGDIVLVPFPFTDLSAKKVRPALVISVNNNVDAVVVFISSVIPNEPCKTELLLEECHPDFALTGLKKLSVIKVNKILTLDRQKISRRLGKLSEVLQSNLDMKLKIAFGLK